jgi:transcriptional regulator with XRE-family HTH domain
LLKSQKMNVGADLVRARHFRGLSIDEISNRTKIRRETLSAIEKNRVDDLSALDLRGALRAYAAEVQLDPDDVIERYVAQFEAQPRVKELADSKWGIDVFPSEATLVPHPVVALRSRARQQPISHSDPSRLWQWENLARSKTPTKLSRFIAVKLWISPRLSLQTTR